MPWLATTPPQIWPGLPSVLPAGVAKAGVGELGVFDRIAAEVEGEGAVARLPDGAAGEGGDEEAVGRVAAGDGQMREGQLHFAADADGILLRGRRGGGGGEGADGLREW